MKGRVENRNRRLLLALFVAGMAQSLLCPVPVRAMAEDATSIPSIVVVGADPDYPPYEFIDRNGQPAGFNTDLTRAIAEVMGMAVEFRFGKWSEMRAALTSGHIDVLQGISYSDARSRELDFAAPHAIVHHSIFARLDSPRVESLEELRGRKVIVFRGGIMDDYLTAHGYGDDLVRTGTPADVMRLLASGQHDFAVLATLPGMYITRELQLTNVKPVVKSVLAEKYGYAVKKGDAELLSRFNEGLAILKKTGRYQSIHDKWLGVLEPQPVSWRIAGRYIAIVVFPLLLVLGGTVLWSRSLQKQVAQRTESLAREVTERKRAAEELRLHQQQLVQAGKMAALGTLVSGVAHEVNNPTGFILLNMPILKGAFLDAIEILDAHEREQGDFALGGLPYSRMREEIPHMLEEMLQGARRIRHIVDDLKNFSRKEDALRFESVDLNAVAQAAVRLVDNSIRKSTRRFETNLADALPKVQGNPQRIEQVIVNLLVNACQALPDSSRGISLSTRHDPDRGTVTVELRDEGVGIAPEHMPHLTDPFFTTKRESGGTGLGLSVSAGIVKEHGGSLQFSSTPGAGTTVTLTLPAASKELRS
jgi:polar amino acid transport system substrate-binding protein